MFRIVASLALSIFLAAFHGPIQKQANEPGSLIPGTPNLRVELGLNTAGEVKLLQVYRGQQLIQALDVCTAGPVARTKTAGTLATADYNFDGFPDLALQVTGEKDNNLFCVWLFDPKQQLFEPSPQLSQLTDPVPDAESRTVISTKYGTCPYCYERQEFQWSGAQLNLVRDESLVMDSLAVGSGECEYIRTIKQRKNGKLREVDRRRATSMGHRCTDGWIDDAGT